MAPLVFLGMKWYELLSFFAVFPRYPMFCCICCENPRLTGREALTNGIELPREWLSLMPAKEDTFRVPRESLERRGLTYLGGKWYTPDLEPIRGIYVLR